MDTILKDNTFVNDWTNQIHSKVAHIPDNVLSDALHYIEDKGIPTLKTEEYRNIPIESILKRYFRKLKITDTNEIKYNIDKDNTILLSSNEIKTFNIENSIDIFYQNNLPDKFHLLIGKSEMHLKDFFAALNTAYCSKILVIHIKGKVEKPINIIHYLSNQENFSQNRILVIAEKETDFTVFEEYYSEELSEPFLYNSLSEIFINENATGKWINFQNSSANLYHINNVFFSVNQNAKLYHHQISLNAALWRNNINVLMNGQESNANLKGLSIGKQQNFISQNTAIIHRVPNAQSNQLYKNIADDKSTVLFNGFILVEPNAQKTDAYQNSKNILLNDNATIFARPQLEIYADDVKCSHGSSTGALNEDALFYLKARGIDEQTAQKLLLKAFYADIIESIENTDIREYIDSKIEI